MYLKLNANGNITAFSSRPAVGYVGVERELYNRARVKYTSLQMQRRRNSGEIEIEIEPEDLRESMELVKAKNFELFLIIVGNRAGGIKPEHVIYSPEADKAREGFYQINSKDYLKNDSIGCALAWSNGNLYDPSKPFAKMEEDIQEKEEEANGTGSVEHNSEPEPEGAAVDESAKPKARKKRGGRKKKNTASASGSNAGTEAGNAPTKGEGVQETKAPVTEEDPWAETE